MATASTWRYRRCPECLEVTRTDRFKGISTLKAFTTVGDAAQPNRQCPRCGYRGHTSEFPIEQGIPGDSRPAAVASYRDTPIPWQCSRCKEFDDHDALTLVGTKRIHRDTCEQKEELA